MSSTYFAVPWTWGTGSCARHCSCSIQPHHTTLNRPSAAPGGSCGLTYVTSHGIMIPFARASTTGNKTPRMERMERMDRDHDRDTVGHTIKRLHRSAFDQSKEAASNQGSIGAPSINPRKQLPIKASSERLRSIQGSSFQSRLHRGAFEEGWTITREHYVNDHRARDSRF